MNQLPGERDTVEFARAVAIPGARLLQPVLVSLRSLRASLHFQIFACYGTAATSS